MFPSQQSINVAMLLETTYNEFVAKPLKSGEENKIYIRGRVENENLPAHAVFRISEVANELIPWPQVINKAESLGFLRLDYYPDRIQSGLGLASKDISETFCPRGGELVINRFRITKMASLV